jgi:hypothetical protein
MAYDRCVSSILRPLRQSQTITSWVAGAGWGPSSYIHIQLTLSIHTSANTAQAGGRIDLDGHKLITSSVCKHSRLFNFHMDQNRLIINSVSFQNRLQLSHQRLVFYHWVRYFHNFTVVKPNEKLAFCFNCGVREAEQRFPSGFAPVRRLLATTSARAHDHMPVHRPGRLQCSSLARLWGLS